jgi:hypothetical protein
LKIGLIFDFLYVKLLRLMVRFCPIGASEKLVLQRRRK